MASGGGESEGPTRESFAAGRLDYPQYTRPADFRGWRVPDVLLSGDHGRIARWRRREALRRTLARRPDLVEAVPLTREEREWMDEMTRSGELTRTGE